MALDVHKIVGSINYRELFPHIRLGSQAKDQEGKIQERANEWGIAGHRGGFKAVGRGGGVSGFPAEYAIVDDPIKGREEANSPTIRKKAWEWLQDEILARLGASGSCLIMHTRWHDEDMVGRIKKQMRDQPASQRWEFLELPARMDNLKEKHPEDPRSLGESLWPWYYAGKKDGIPAAEQEALAKEFLSSWEITNPFGFYSLGQQSPRPRTGGLFDASKILVVDRTPSPVLKSIRYWDKAATQDGGKRTAGGQMAKLKNGQYLIQHMRKGQWAAHLREQNIRAQAETDGKAVEIWIEREPGSGGKDSAQWTASNLAGFRVKIDNVSGQGDKETRAEPLADQVGAGNVLMLRGDWNQELLDELEAFPHGSFKDQVDSLSGAFNNLTKRGSYSLSAINTR
jgi:predicted phage terminase large subunit-like protein